MEFGTTNLPLAAAIVAANKLALLRIDSTDKQATLVFDDPDSEGSAHELAFLSGHLFVPANQYNMQLRALRRAIEVKLAAARKNGGQ